MRDYWHAYLRLPPERAVIGLRAFFAMEEAQVIVLNLMLDTLVVVRP